MTLTKPKKPFQIGDKVSVDSTGYLPIAHLVGTVTGIEEGYLAVTYPDQEGELLVSTAVGQWIQRKEN